MAVDMKENGIIGCAYYVAVNETLFLPRQPFVCCAGAVLGELQRRRAVEYLPNDSAAETAFRVRSIEMFMLEQCMFVNADTLESLQILRAEFHPNSQMRGPDHSTSSAKESLSLYGLIASGACTSMGRERLRQMFLRPVVDIDLINERQQTVAVFLQHNNSAAVGAMRKNLRKIKDVKGPLHKLRKGVAIDRGKISVHKSVWSTLLQFAIRCIELKKALQKLVGGPRVVIVVKALEIIDSRVMTRVGEMIQSTIDFEQSKESGKTSIRLGVSQTLDELKREYDGLADLLSTVAYHLGSKVPEWAKLYIKACTFYPQLGFLTAVPLDPATGKGRYEGEGLGEDRWRRMWVDGDTVYYKNAMMYQLDEEKGDLYCAILDVEIEIGYSLGIQVLEYEDALIAAGEVCSELDSLLALAVGAEKYNWTAPKMTEENIIGIDGGRHPLQELVVPAFIDNDCRLFGGSGLQQPASEGSETGCAVPGPNMLVLTRPNHSGKSVYLKQVALIVFLAHIGSYVPAARAVIGLTDRLLTRVATRESVSCHASAFSIDLRQAAFSINFASQRSLIIIDEFGKGTNALDGAGLAAGLLDHFLSLGREAPKVLVASHFHEVFENGFFDETRGLAYAHMEVRINQGGTARANSDDSHNVIYLFRLEPGRSTSSLGSRCAAMNGIDAAIVERAEALMLLLARGEDLQAACAKLSPREEEDLEGAEVVGRRFLEMELGEEEGDGESDNSTFRVREELAEVLGLGSE